MTLDEKCAFVAGADLWHNPGCERLGLRPLKVSDGPVGVRGEQWTGEARSTSFPCGSHLGSTWDVELLERVGECIGREARDKGVHVVLGPTVNLHRTPLAGRNMECYSEDPLLSGKLGAAWIRGLQSQRVGCTVKHFVANDQEYERHSISAEVDERTLRELYLRPFEIAVREGGAWGVMSAYNRVNGVHCSEHPWLLSTVLREEWGFDGFVISDWYGCHSTEPMARSGMDLEMPGPHQWFGARLAEAIRAGAIEEAHVDRMVANLLQLYDRTGALDADDDRHYGEELSIDRPEYDAVALAAAVGGMVLLKNDSLLPLDPSTTGSIALIGPNAEVANIQGGGSAQLNPRRQVTPLEGLRARFGDDRVRFARGCSSWRTVPPIEARLTANRSGFVVDYFDNVDLDGAPRRTDRIPRGNLMWLGQWADDVPLAFSARCTTTFVPDETGDWTLALQQAGRARLFVDGEVVVDNREPQPGDFFFGMGSAEARGVVALQSGVEYRVEVEFSATTPGLSGLLIGALPPLPDDMLETAVEVARAADVAVVVVGTNGDWETEGRDRESIELPMQQRELIERVAAANARTVVCVNAGAALDLGWLTDVGAALWCGLPGQEWGTALAAVLAGDDEPSGRLATTMPKRLEDTAAFTNYPGEAGQVHYGERVFMGYRWHDTRAIEPAACFGHGLSYTTFEYANLMVTPEVVADDDRVTITIDVTNTGERLGSEVVQCYVGDVEASVARPEQELVSFAKIELDPGETKTVDLDIDVGALAFWSIDDSQWRVEPGTFEVRIGASSRDIRAAATLQVRR